MNEEELKEAQECLTFIEESMRKCREAPAEERLCRTFGKGRLWSYRKIKKGSGTKPVLCEAEWFLSDSIYPAGGETKGLPHYGISQ